MNTLLEVSGATGSENLHNLPPIPKETVAGWKEISVKECGEKLVPVGAFSGFSDCDTSAVYFGERGEGKGMNFLGMPVDRRLSLITHFVREGVLERLKVAQNLLPKGYYFCFFDNYRPLAVQQELYDTQRAIFQGEHPDWADEELDRQTQVFVSLPSPNPKRGTVYPSSHSTGGVVDLTIVKMSNEDQDQLEELERRKKAGELTYPIGQEELLAYQKVAEWIGAEAIKQGWEPATKKEVQENWLSEYRYAREKARFFREFTEAVDMGTYFDEFVPEAATRYYEDLVERRSLSEEEMEVLKNRRFLYQVMRGAGFSNYPDEWWHWSYGDNMDAVNRKKDHAIYGGARMTEENEAFEKARRGPFLSPRLFM